MAFFGVTVGVIKRLLAAAGETLPSFKLQVLSIKKVAQQAASTSGRPTDRYRVVISDTVSSYSSVMLATHFNSLVDSGQLSPYSVIRVDRYQISSPENVDRPVIVLLSVHVEHTADEVGQVLGNPQSLAQRDTHAAQQKPQPAATIPRPPVLPPSVTSPSSTMPSKPAGQMPRGNFPGSTTKVATPNLNSSMMGPIQGRKIVPIAGLSPYQNRWTVRARVTLKTPIKTWSNSRGEGRLFSFNLLDESGEIRCTAFTAECERFFSVIEVNKVYYISKGTLKVANKQFSGAIQHDYEMQLTQETEIEACDDDGALPTVSFDFVRISDIEQKSVNDIMDVIGVAREIGQIRQLTSKQGRAMMKRDVFLADSSGYQVPLTMWGTEAENFEPGAYSLPPIVAAKNARVNEFSGTRSLTTGANCQLLVNPDIPEAHSLRGWFDREGVSMEFISIKSSDGGMGGGGFGGTQSNWRLLNDLRVLNLGSGDRPDFVSAVGTIGSIKKENCVYKGCPQEGCNKKVLEQPGTDSYRCEKCQREFSNFKYQLMLNVHLMDATDGVWVTVFRDQAETILGASADHIGQLKDNPDSGNEGAFDEIIQAASFSRWLLRLRVRMETYNDETRRKASCVSIGPVDAAEYHRNLISRIETTAAAL